MCNGWFDFSRWLAPLVVRVVRVALVSAVGTSAWVGTATAAPRAVETFDARTWAALTAARAPTAVVFTTTDCTYCPGVIRDLAKQVRSLRRDAAMVVVVMDVAPGDDDAALLHEPHHALADRLYAFAGNAAALRHGVNPAWRGITPYVVLLRPDAAPVAVTGRPSLQAVQAWVQAWVQAGEPPR